MKYYVEYFIELLMIQWVSCVYIYSVLDLIVCKINFVKFMFGKCFVFIVIDLVVWGLDILLLDNVINYSFFVKGKFFLYCVGCVVWVG